ncbi:MAG: peptidoglycan DD-metalloendopeptidase family protein [Streptosporangiales bacterium]|nr:peptidoglycan DD-metalloendopeptidase family protein [Streptosporangiales bacterium]MBO0890421.1 peptidoglycan DD-metalloendopeptidase family protein [Acidothermales bacterium]
MKRPEFRPRHLFAPLVALSVLLITGTAHAATTANGASLSGARAKPSKTAKASPTDPDKIRSELSRLGDQYAASERTLGRLAQRQDQLARQMAATKARLTRLRAHLSQMAVAAYMSGQVDSTMVVLADTSSGPDQVVERLTTLSMMSNVDAAAMSAAKRETSRLAGQRTSLAGLRKQAKAEQNSLEAKKKKLNAALLAAARAAADRANGASRSARMTNGGACPVGSPYTVMNTFGASRGGGRAHQGDDLPAPKGTPIYAVENGTISRAYYNTLGGIALILRGRSGDSYYYAHQEVNLVHTGQHVVAGQMIARVGMTGDAQGTIYHLHFERWPNGGSAVDPYQFLLALCGKKG